MTKISVDTETLLHQRERLKKQLDRYQEALASPIISPPEKVALIEQRDAIERKLKDIERKIEAFVAADEAVETVQSIAGRVEDNLQAIRVVVAEPEHVTSLEQQITTLMGISSQAIQQLKTSSLAGIKPRLSIIRPDVRLVDANLAYKYADLQSDANTMLGFTTLFVGTGISAVVSLGISLSTSTMGTVVAIHAVVTVMSLLVSLIFGYLTWQVRRKSEEVRKLLETDVGAKEIALRLAFQSDESPSTLMNHDPQKRE